VDYQKKDRRRKLLKNTRVQLALVLVAGVAAGVLGMWLYSANQAVKPHIVEGYSNGVNYDVTAIGISDQVGGDGNGYVIGGAMWREFDGPWSQSGSAPSLEYGSYGQRMRLGVVNVKTPGGGSMQVVAWYEVLDTKNMVMP
jgi:hypothetical protein